MNYRNVKVSIGSIMDSLETSDDLSTVQRILTRVLSARYQEDADRLACQHRGRMETLSADMGAMASHNLRISSVRRSAGPMEG